LTLPSRDRDHYGTRAMNVDIDKLRTLLDVLDERDIAEFEHEADGIKLRVVRATRLAAPLAAQAGYTHFAAAHGVAAPPAAAHTTASGTSVAPPEDVVEVTSPFVGTFYRSPTPDAPPFAEVGSVVRPGQTLCIIEAMKLMNEIEAECSGTIVEVFAQNGKPVEFGQKLFRIKKA
jgi:acetyl-CoA carboxylase biotin carboxyl carrier protein